MSEGTNTAIAELIPSLPSAPAQIEERWSVLGCNAARERLLEGVTDDRAAAYARNIERFIGEVRVPVGAIGPLRIRGSRGACDYYVPLATTEATLVASYGRGARLLSSVGGCTVRAEQGGLARAPGFIFDSLSDSCDFVKWIATRRPALQHVAESTSRHLQLLSVSTCMEANHVYLMLNFSTGDAAGQNMVTIAAQAIVEFIRARSPVTPVRAYVESNFSGDKKASMQSLTSGRGRSACAEVIIPADVVEAQLRVTPAMMVEYFRLSSMAAVLTGAIGAQGHFANGLTALFIACGQDVACVAECAVGVTRFEERADGSLYASVSLPNLTVGTVGGGTGLPTQRACLEILGLNGPGKANTFAEVCAAVALAGELSIVGAIVADEFTRAHRTFARRSTTATNGRAL